MNKAEIEKEKNNRSLFIVLLISCVFLLLVIIYISHKSIEIEKESYNYGCAYGCYYGLGKDEVPLNFSFDNNQMACILKCVKDYGEWK